MRLTIGNGVVRVGCPSASATTAFNKVDGQPNDLLPTIEPVTDVKRPYHAPTRTEQAARTRDGILHAADDLFSAHGWSGTTIADIARAARVSPQAVHQSIGAKPALLIAAVQRAAGGDSAELPLVEREPFRIAYAADAPLPERAAAFAKGTREVYQRAGRLLLVLAQASPLDPELAELWDRARARRLADCRKLVSATATRGRATQDRLTDLLFVQSGPGVYAELVSERGWSARAYQEWLAGTVETLLQTDAGRS